MLKRTFAALVAFLAILGGTQVVTQSPALAAYSDCVAGPGVQACLFDAAGGTSTRVDILPAFACKNLTNPPQNPHFNDKTTSVVNFSSYRLTLYEHTGCTGASYQVGTTAGMNLPAAQNNWASSYKISLNYFYSGAAFEYPAANAYDGIRATVNTNNPWKASYSFHSLAELAAQSADGKDIVEIGWTKNSAVCPDTTQACLFGYHWINGVQQGYGVNFTDANLGGPNLGDPVPSGKIADFRILHDASSGTGVWWLWADLDINDATTPANYVGYFLDSLWTPAGRSFTSIGLSQVFGEVASSSFAPCDDMGSAVLPPGAGAARFENIGLHTTGTSGSVTNYVATNPSLGSPNPNAAWYNVSAYTSSPITAIRYGGGGANCKAAPEGVSTPIDSNLVKGRWTP